MNIFFGIASKKASGQFGSMRRDIEKLFRQDSRTLSSRHNEFCCGYIEDGGSILGTAVHEQYCLIFCGMLQSPLPEWRSGSPLDKPDDTARYLLNRYLATGSKFLDNVLGQYGVAVYDPVASKFLLGSDPGGFRRLFFCNTDGSLVFGTNLLSLNAAHENGIAIDRSLEDFLLGYEFLPWQRTPFKNAHCLAAGTLLEFKNGNIQTKKIKTAASSPIPCDWQNEQEVIDTLHDKFIHAIESQCPSENRLSILLGGFDSALIASVLTRLGKSVETFSFSFPDSQYNQAHTDTLSRFLGTRHNWVDISPKIISEGLQNYPLMFNQPAGQMHYLIETAHLCSVIRSRGYRHCFTGDGCDELFLGYPTVYQRTRLFMRLGVLPENVARFIKFLGQNYFFEKHFGHAYRFARNLISVMARDMPVRGHISHRVFDELSLSRLRQNRNPPQEKNVEQILENLAAGLHDLSPLRLAYHGKSSVGLNKTKIDGCSALSGLSLQSPFQYSEFVQFARSIPDGLLRPQGENRSQATGKYILMRMAESKKLLPPEIIYQKKASPVTAPVDDWYMNELKPELLEMLNHLPFECNLQYAEDLLGHKLAEDFFKKHVGIGKYSSHAISLLATYASFSRYAEKQCLDK